MLSRQRSCCCASPLWRFSPLPSRSRAPGDFLLEVSCWAWEYCMKFPFEAPSRWEHPLEFTQLHAEYRELFEGRANEGWPAVCGKSLETRGLSSTP
eukprot:g4082.t1